MLVCQRPTFPCDEFAYRGCLLFGACSFLKECYIFISDFSAVGQNEAGSFILKFIFIFSRFSEG